MGSDEGASASRFSGVFRSLLHDLQERDVEQKPNFTGSVFSSGMFIGRLGVICAVMLYLAGARLWPQPHRLSGTSWTIDWAAVIGYALLSIAVFKSAWPILQYIQVCADVVFVSIVYAATGNVESAAFALYGLPVLMVAHCFSARWFLAGTAGICVIATAIILVGLASGARFGLSAETRGPISWDETMAILFFVLYRLAALVGCAVVLRLYRQAHQGAILYAEIKGRRLRALQEGIQCGICEIEINRDRSAGDGRILQWNLKQASKYAPPGAEERRARGHPCYYVFHEQHRPCAWCGLPWEPIGGDDAPETRRFRIDTEELEKRIERGENWAISNQLAAGPKGKGVPRLHLYQIQYGAIYEQPFDGPKERNDGRNRILGVVEAVSEITDTVLEMPFLLPNQHSSEVPPGMPPISVLDTGKRIVGMNRAKEARSNSRKDDLLGKLCYKAYVGPRCAGSCERCPVDLAIASNAVVRGMAQHPGDSMLTCVPVPGPDGKTRAIMEFIDPLADVLALMAGLQRLNSAADSEEIARVGLDSMREIAAARFTDPRVRQNTMHECLALTIEGDTVIQRGAAMRDWALSDWGILEEQGAGRTVTVEIPALFAEPRVPASVRTWAAERQIGPASLIAMRQTSNRVASAVLVARTDRSERVPHDTLHYCGIVAEGMAIAHERALHRNRAEHLVRHRSQVIEVVQETYGCFDGQAALRTVISRMPEMLPMKEEGFSVSAYSIVYPGVGVSIGNVRSIDPKKIGITFIEGTGSPEFTSRAGDKWRRGRRIEPITDTTLRLLSEAKPKSFSIGAFEGAGDNSPLLLEETRSVLILPLVYHDRVFGCLVAESPKKPPSKAFPGDISESLGLLAVLCGLLVGRYRMAAEAIDSMGHIDTYLEPIKKLARVAVDHPCTGESAEANQQLWQILADLNEEIKARQHACYIAMGQPVKPGCVEINVQRVLEQTAERLGRLQPQSRDWIVLGSAPGAVPACTLPEALLTTVVLELVLNALKYGKPETRVMLNAEESNDCVTIRVSNTPVAAIEKEVVDHMFDLWYRYAPTASADDVVRSAGTGIGLWQARVILEAREAGICLELNSSTETVFAITIGKCTT